MDKTLIVVALGVVAFVGTAAFLSTGKRGYPEASMLPSEAAAVYTPSMTSQAQQASATPQAISGLVEPVANFKQRVTKKFFGTHVTPNNSPVQPEKFTGYHTGADAEYGDVEGDVSVHAIADGTVLLARWASGYGGVVAIQHKVNSQSAVAIYGHLNPDQLPKVGAKVTAGQQIGILGKGFSHETDGERKHLHFGLVKGVKFTLLGYVPNKSQLSAWIDPLTVF